MNIYLGEGEGCRLVFSQFIHKKHLHPRQNNNGIVFVCPVCLFMCIYLFLKYPQMSHIGLLSYISRWINIEITRKKLTELSAYCSGYVSPAITSKTHTRGERQYCQSAFIKPYWIGHEPHLREAR